MYGSNVVTAENEQGDTGNVQDQNSVRPQPNPKTARFAGGLACRCDGMGSEWVPFISSQQPTLKQAAVSNNSVSLRTFSAPRDVVRFDGFFLNQNQIADHATKISADKSTARDTKVRMPDSICHSGASHLKT